MLPSLNIKDYVNNVVNILEDLNIQNAPLIRLTETHLASIFSKNHAIEGKMPDSESFFSNSNDKLKGLVLVF